MRSSLFRGFHLKELEHTYAGVLRGVKCSLPNVQVVALPDATFLDKGLKDTGSSEA